MQATKRLSSAGQSIWLDNITRDLLLTGTLEQYIRDLSVTGLTSNPTIFDHALRHGSAYDASLRAATRPGISRDELFFELALDDITRAADLFRRSPRRRISMREPTGRTCSSRFRARPTGSRRSRSRSSRESRSM
jgi:hypothetical protein